MSNENSIDNVYETAKSIKALVAEMVDKVNEMNTQTMTSLGLSKEFCDKITTLSDDEISSISLVEIDQLLNGYGIDDIHIKDDFSKMSSDIPTIEKWRKLLFNIKESFSVEKDALLNTSEIDGYIKDIYEKQADYLESDEYKEAYDNSIKKLRALVDTEQDEVARKKHISRLNALENSKSLDFLKNRFEKYGEKEVKRLIEIFFDRTRSDLLLKRYEANVKKINISEKFHITFYNLEEIFLPEEFHILNNFFLFVVMGFVAYADMTNDTDRLYVTSIFHRLNLLVNGRMNSTEKRLLLKLMKDIDSYLLYDESIVAQFKEKNIMYKNHPYRIHMEDRIEKIREEKRLRSEIYDEIKSSGKSTVTIRGTGQPLDVLNELEYKDLVGLAKELDLIEDPSSTTDTDTLVSCTS